MATDLNINWKSKRDKTLIQNDECLRQSIQTGLYLSKDSIIWGRGREPDLSSLLFEMMGSGNNMFTMRELGHRIRDFDSRLMLRENESSITAVGDQWQLNLIIEYTYGSPIIINQRISRI
jgi:hypothetical protein